MSFLTENTPATLTQNRSKIWLLGSEHTGKTTMLSSLLSGAPVHSKNYKQTQSPELSLYRHKNVELYILDTPGHNSYSNLTSTHLDRRDAAGIVLVFDVTSKESLADLKKYIKIWKSFDKSRPQHNGCLPVALVGMKKDLVNRRIVTSKQGSGLVAKLLSGGSKNIKYFEASIKEPNSILDVYNWLGETVHKVNGQYGGSDILKMMEDPRTD